MSAPHLVGTTGWPKPDARPVRPALGVLTLCNTVDSIAIPGSMRHPGTLAFPVITATVRGAWSERVCGPASSELALAYVNAAQDVTARGASAIVADCGFAVSYQAEVSGAVAVPVALSPLLHIPRLREQLSPRAKIGVICAYRDRLTESHLRSAGIAPPFDDLVIRGFDDTPTGDNWLKPAYTTNWDQVERDVTGVMELIFDECSAISDLVFECTGVCQCAPAVSAHFGRPVHDWVTLCNELMPVQRRHSS